MITQRIAAGLMIRPHDAEVTEMELLPKSYVPKGLFGVEEAFGEDKIGFPNGI
jgi:hypothetical protein